MPEKSKGFTSHAQGFLHKAFFTIGNFAPPHHLENFPPVDFSAPTYINPHTKQQFSSFFKQLQALFLEVQILES